MCISPSYMTPLITADEVRWIFRPEPGSSVLDPETGEILEPFPVGCGKCLECISLHKRQWTFRLLQEASLYDKNCFLTLTYADDPGSVRKDHVQKFIHDLRKFVDPVRVRYYACGEYGSKGRRPHYHVIIFGYDFDDKFPYRRDRKGFMMYRSSSLEKIWRHGFSSILPVRKETLSYVTKDMQKLLPLSDGRVPPFTLMSLKPGIGVRAWSKNVSDGNLWLSGECCPLPRYYKKVAEREGIDLTTLHRVQSSMPRRDFDFNRFDSYSSRVRALKKKINKI